MGTYTGSDKRLQYLFQNGGGGGASALSDLTDVELTNLANNQIIKWDSANSKWVNANESGGGGSANIWTGTQAEYTAQASQIADGTLVNITDDEEQTQAMFIYSTEERVVGTYLGKTLYRKAFVLSANHGTVAGSTWKAIPDIDDSNMEIVTSCKYIYSDTASIYVNYELDRKSVV